MCFIFFEVVEPNERNYGTYLWFCSLLTISVSGGHYEPDVYEGRNMSERNAQPLGQKCIGLRMKSAFKAAFELETSEILWAYINCIHQKRLMLPWVYHLKCMNLRFIRANATLEFVSYVNFSGITFSSTARLALFRQSNCMKFPEEFIRWETASSRNFDH
jgi:hypothetical protein